MTSFRIVTAAMAVLAGVTLASAQDKATDKPAQERPARAVRSAPDTTGVLRLLPEDAVSEKTVMVGGKPLAYTATAGTTPLYDQNGDKSAAIFYTAYVAKNSSVQRPLTFVFNGGPGAASVYLHLGLAGPRILDFGADGRDGAAAKLVDNPDTWLGFTDLVMIDPVGTGWSRSAKPDDAKGFWGVRRDAESIAKFIALYVGNNERTASPKYLLGESYGGFRAAKVARAMLGDQGIATNGIVMVSPMIDGALQWGGGRTAFGAALHFPSFVATELERGKRFTPEAMAEAERFATGEYLTTMAGPAPTGDRAKAFYGTIARMTGIAPEVVARARGHVRSAYLAHLKAQGEVVSAYDGAFAVPDPFPESGSRGGSDPILDGFTRVLQSIFVGYARSELGFKTEMTYSLLNNDVNRQWDWGGSREPAGASEDLRMLIAFEPSFRLLVAHGRTDLVTPYGVSRYLLNDMPTPAGGADRVQLKLYRGGHMFYTDAATRKAFTAEARDFYQRAP